MWAKRRSDALLAIVLCDLRQLFGLDPTPTFTDDRGIDPRVLEVERLARSQLNNWRTEDMAQAAGMSRSAFSRFYRSVRGFAPGFFLDESRRRYAEAALQDLEPDMALISASIGFRNPSDFARWFRRRYDCSPREYHQRLHGR
jgi:AraC-like DNA-binding protein